MKIIGHPELALFKFIYAIPQQSRLLLITNELLVSCPFQQSDYFVLVRCLQGWKDLFKITFLPGVEAINLIISCILFI